MSDQFPRLADVVRQHRLAEYMDLRDPFASQYRCDCGWKLPELECTTADHPEHVEQVWREAWTVRTAERLDALPDRTVILDVDGVVLRRNPWLSENPALWFPLDGYSSLEQDFGIAAEDIDLPARVIHNPDRETK